jgi:hypothetical protein
MGAENAAGPRASLVFARLALGMSIVDIADELHLPLAEVERLAEWRLERGRIDRELELKRDATVT